MTGSFLAGVSRLLKTPVKVNNVAFSFFGVSDSSLAGESLLLEEAHEGQRRSIPSFGVMRSFLKLSLSLKKFAKATTHGVGFSSLFLNVYEGSLPLCSHSSAFSQTALTFAGSVQVGNRSFPSTISYVVFATTFLYCR